MNEEIILEKGLLYRIRAIRYRGIHVEIVREIRRSKYSKYWKFRAYGALKIEHCSKIHKEWGQNED